MKRKLLPFIVLLLLTLMLNSCYSMEPLENLSVMIGIGYDYEENKDKRISDPIELIVFKGDREIKRFVSQGKAETIYNTVNDRQTIMSKKFLVGTEKVYLISKRRAEYGIEDLLDVLIRDNNRSELAYVTVTDGPVDEFFSLEPIDYNTSSEAIEGILKFCSLANFFPKDVNIFELLSMYNQTGRRIILPFIKNDNGIPKISGICVFDKAKLKYIIPLDEAFYINMLRSRKSNGYISVLKENNNKLCYTVKATNFVDVNVDYEDKLIYNINVTLKCVLKADSINNKPLSAKEAKEIEKALEEKVKAELTKTIDDVQNKYKVDCFDITKYAAAKFGKHSPLLSDEEFQRAKINVDVKVKIVDLGRSIK
ncbi:MAG: Ger(x)C family spore germination protein [Clostridiales bacterium]|nr:Ger(x)C family spore germination protein [Clostridiales bacterium]